MNFTTEIILTPIETELNITVVELDEEISFDQIDFVVEVQFLEGLQGIPGKQIELGKSSTHLQWRYVGDTAWINLTPLSDITGANGASCEFQVSATHIQWRVVGDADWIDLIALSEFKGDPGKNAYQSYLDTTTDNPPLSEADWSKSQNIPFVEETQNKFLRDDKTFVYIPTPAGGYANNLYLGETNSDVPTYKILTYNSDASETIKTVTANAESGVVTAQTFLYPSGVSVSTFPSGLWSLKLWGHISASAGVSQVGFTYFKRSVSGVETDLFTIWGEEINNTVATWIDVIGTQPSYAVDPTDRMGLRLLFKTTSNSDKTLTYAIGDGYAAFVNNPNQIRHSQTRAKNDELAFQHIDATVEKLISEANDKLALFNFTTGKFETILSSYFAKSEDLTNGLGNKVDKLTGYSLVADTEIAKIHTRNTDSTLLSDNGQHSVYVDNSGVFQIKGLNINGEIWETHAQQIFTTKNEIILRDGAVAGLGVGEYVGLRAKLYDGVNDGNLVFDRDGWARVGDVGALQKLATIEENPTNGYLMKYNTTTYRLESIDPLTLPVSMAALRQFVSNEGGTIYHISRWFTPTSALTIAANGLSATITSNQFTAAMTGSQFKITNGANKPIITYVNSNTINFSYAVDSSFFGQSIAIADWGVYSREKISAGGAVRIYSTTGAVIITVFDTDTTIYSNSLNGNILSGNNFRLPNGGALSWSSTSDYSGTKDTALYRPSAGRLKIYDGIDTNARRDLELRSLFSDKIIPNSDSTGVAIRNAADTQDVVKLGSQDAILLITKSTYDSGLKEFSLFDGYYQYNIGKTASTNSGANNRYWSLYQAGSEAVYNTYLAHHFKVGDTTIFYAKNGFFGIKTITPETTLDINGTTTLRDYTYLNNGTHTGDAVGDYRTKTINNVKVTEVCTVANATRGSGTWKRASGVSDIGGKMISLTNKTGAASVKGSVVSLSSTTASAFVLQSNEFDAIGIVYESGVSDGSECWVVVVGIAEVLLEDNTASTTGNWVISSTVDGRANASQPTPQPNTTINEHTTHFKEIGHCMETKTAGTSVLAKCVIHFN